MSSCHVDSASCGMDMESQNFEWEGDGGREEGIWSQGRGWV